MSVNWLTGYVPQIGSIQEYGIVLIVGRLFVGRKKNDSIINVYGNDLEIIGGRRMRCKICSYFTINEIFQICDLCLEVEE